MKTEKIYNGESLEVLKGFPDKSVDMVMTSPPYFALRDYNVVGQLGLENTHQEYIEKLCDIFDEIKRVLKDEGTCWVNIADTYNGTKSGCTDTNKNGKVPADSMIRKKRNDTMKEKSLMQIPSRFAIEMTARGWILRNRIVWHKPNVMPSSARDRFTVDYEDLFFFTKNKKYYFEQQFDPYAPSSDVRYRQALRAGRSYNSKEPYKKNAPYSGYKRGQGSVKSRGNDADGLVVGGTNPKGRNKRCVWSIPTKPNRDAHFATYPEKLCEIPILSGCPIGGVVLDPFVGSGTTAVVAIQLGRKYVGIDLNPEYVTIAENRIKNVQIKMF